MEHYTEQALEFDKVTAYLAQLTISPLGRAQASTLTAMTDTAVIERQLAEVSELKDIRALHGPLPLDGFHDIRESLLRARIENSILAPLELRQIYETLRVARAVKKCMAGIDSPDYGLIRGKVERLIIVADVERAIGRSIDEEKEILDSASPKLKQLRRELRQAREKIQSWLQNFLQRATYQSVIQDQVITLRQNRYVIPIKASSRGKVKGIIHDQSASGVTVFIEPLETVELNNRVASLASGEKQEIRRILQELTTLVREHRFEIEETVIGLGELDFINGKTKLSEQWGCQPPKITDRRMLNLLQARHPLLLLQHDQDRASVIPIDLRLDEQTNTLLITGPNTGGKTVSLKTVGLLTLMVQAGLHIPAAKDSETCVFETIFADIGDQQSIEQSLSTFSSHIQHIVNVLGNVTERSLVLLDELGAGTDPAEGAALGIAILKHLDTVRAKCIATTHHDALKSYAYTHPRTINACVEFDVNTLSPTYRLLFGVPGKSNAFIIAERLGVPEHIIQRARALMGQDVLRVDELIRKLTSDSEEIERKKSETEARHRGVLRLEKETDKLLAAAEKEREDILERALKEAKKIVDQAIKQSQDVLRTLPASTREEGKTQLKTLHKETSELQRKLHRRKPPGTEDEPGSEVTAGGVIKPGTKVRLAGFEQTGTVLTLSKDGRQAEVQVGAMRVEMPVRKLTALRPAERSPAPSKISVSDHSISSSGDYVVPFELLLVGKRVDEALDEVNTYLDRAVLSGLSSVSIVHGIGTGKLKKAITNMLRSHHHVVSYALDTRNYGMTNVELSRK